MPETTVIDGQTISWGQNIVWSDNIVWGDLCSSTAFTQSLAVLTTTG